MSLNKTERRKKGKIEREAQERRGETEVR